MKRTLRFGAVALVAAVAGALTLASAASAHVVVSPDSAPAGGYARIAIRVPTESDTLSTIKVDVQLDPKHPVASVATMPVPGWTAQVVTGKLPTPLKDDDGNTVTDGVTEVIWTADSAASAIKPGEFLEFPLSLGPLPTDTDTMTFKAVQTYSDNSVVSWIDLPTAGGAEPEHPAPTLSLVKADAGTTGVKSSSSSALPITLSVIALVLGLGGLALGGLAFRNTKRARTE